MKITGDFVLVCIVAVVFFSTLIVFSVLLSKLEVPSENASADDSKTYLVLKNIYISSIIFSFISAFLSVYISYGIYKSVNSPQLVNTI